MAIQKILRERFKNDVGEPIIGANTTTFTIGDPVALSSGFLVAAGASDRIMGYMVETITTTASNQTVAKYCPRYIRPEGVIMRFGTATLFAQTTIGQYVVLSGTTGGFSVATASSTVGQFVIEAVGTLPDGTFYADVRAVFVPGVTAAS